MIYAARTAPHRDIPCDIWSPIAAPAAAWFLLSLEVMACLATLPRRDPGIATE